MPEDDPHSFELFVRWLYIRTLTPTAVSNSTTAANVMLGKDFTAGSSTACIQDYLRLYVLASKVLVEELENACVDMAHAFYSVGMRRPDVKDGTDDHAANLCSIFHHAVPDVVGRHAHLKSHSKICIREHHARLRHEKAAQGTPHNELI